MSDSQNIKSNRNTGLSYIAMSLFGLLFASQLHDQGGVLVFVGCMIFGFAMLGTLIDGLLIFYGKKLPSGTK